MSDGASPKSDRVWEGTLDHERLDAYRCAVELDDLVVQIVRRSGRGHGWLCDQAHRASGSAVLNLAEAVGREGADRARCIRIARGSVLEADAAVTLRGSGGSRQPDLFARSKQPKISLPDNHPMVVLTDTVDWTGMEVRAEKIREKKLKNAAGRPPRLRATLGALTLMALRRLPYREVGKSVEFGLSWGITRLRGGFVLATMAGAKKDLTDATFAVQAVEQVATLFGRAPRSYAYDRAGHSARNVERLRELGVRDVGLAPRGKTPWEVAGTVRARLVKERALVEGSIGTHQAGPGRSGEQRDRSGNVARKKGEGCRAELARAAIHHRQSPT